MNNYNMRLTLLKKKQILGDKELDIIKKIDTKCAMTDFAISLGGSISNEYYLDYDNSLKGRTCWYYLASIMGENEAPMVNISGDYSQIDVRTVSLGIRPVLTYSDNLKNFKKVKNNHGFDIVEYKEYPQYVVSKKLEQELESTFQSGKIIKTGKTYTTNSRKWSQYYLPFKAIMHEEYEYKGKKYIRMSYNNGSSYILSNNKMYKDGDIVWIKVSPLQWYIDKSSKLLICKNAILSGIKFFENEQFNGNFKTTEIYNFLNTYLAKDIIPSEKKQNSWENPKKINNPYALKFDNVSEEDIIKGVIASDVAVFLHGPSSEGKSARVKQIDPDCIIIYLRNATPESLNGKSVYNQKTGEMIDIKPTWLKKLETICEAEPDKLHIVFFDELTNALPSIQGIAFNIMLDKEVNGIWKLPTNARIVAAGNEMEDSLSANELAEPLFNRFAHVYIKTTTESWLKWAIENKIHPAIYSFIAYKNGEVLRSIYNGKKPNADLRKWEMASKMLYATGKPEMLRALVGEEITKEFVIFCQTKVITLKDVITGNYDEEKIENLNTSEKYVTVASLSQVDEGNYAKVKEFVGKLGKEYIAIFDSIWSQGNEERLEHIATSRVLTK